MFKAMQIAASRLRRRVLVFSLLLTLSFTSCTQKSPPAADSRASSAQRVVNLGIWASYLAPEKIQEFEKRSGIHIQISNYASNEELLAKMQAGGSAFDVVVPSDYMIFAMVKLGLLRAEATDIDDPPFDIELDKQ